MADQVLEGLCVAVLTADGFEQVEVTGALELLDEHGAAVDVVSLRAGTIQGMNPLASGERLDVDETVRTADVFDYDALVLPGGFLGPDLVRQSMHALEFVRTFEDHGKPIATIGHGAQVLISAGLVKGRRLAAHAGIQDDVRNAGGEWIDARVVHDDNWVSSRGPQDLAAFGRAMIAHFAVAAGRPVPRAVGLKGLIVGTAAVAAAGFAVQRRLGPSRGGTRRDGRGTPHLSSPAVSPLRGLGAGGASGTPGPDAPTSYVLREP